MTGRILFISDFLANFGDSLIVTYQYLQKLKNGEGFTREPENSMVFCRYNFTTLI